MLAKFERFTVNVCRVMIVFQNLCKLVLSHALTCLRRFFGSTDEKIGHSSPIVIQKELNFTGKTVMGICIIFLLFYVNSASNSCRLFCEACFY